MPRPREPEIIPRINLLEPLGQGARSIVYRARRGSRMFAVKMPGPPGARIAPDVNEGFLRRALRLACLDHPSLVPIIEVGRTGSGTAYAVFPLVEGRSLERMISSGPQPESSLLPIAKALAGALTIIHSRGLVHGAIRPRNIVLGRRSLVHLLDPDLGGLWPSSEHSPLGSLIYDPPERLGLSFETIETRSDLFSLGAVLYHAATGRPPFRAAHPDELLRQRREERPPQAHRLAPDLSAGFCAVLHKLLAERAADRYRSAESLLLDLGELCLINHEAARSGFVTIDTAPSHLVGPEPAPFVDRMRELDALLEGLDRAMAKRGSVHVIEGEAGIGKTRLVEELIRSAGLKRATVLRADCRREEGIPYAELRRSLQGWLESAGGENVHGTAPRESLMRASAGLAGYLSRFWPLLRDLFPDSPSPPPVPGRNQVESSAAELLIRLARDNAPFVLIVEDSQHLTASSARVLGRLIERIEESGMLLVLTGRPKEFLGRGGLWLQRRLSTSRPHRQRMAPLGANSARALVQGMLGTSVAPRNLIEAIIEQAGGNPLHLREAVNLLLDSGLIAPESGVWVELRPGFARKVAALSLDRLVMGRTEKLSSGADELMRALACSGPIGCPLVIAHLLDVTQAELRGLLLETMEAGFVSHWPVRGFGIGHPLIEEILLSHIDSGKRSAIHHRAAEAIEVFGFEGQDRLFRSANQYARTTAGPPTKKALFAHIFAGCAASKARAYQEALPHLERALDIATSMEPPRRSLLIVLESSLGEACYQTGLIDRASKHFHRVIELGARPIQVARAHARLSDIDIMELRAGAAWEELERAFAALGRPNAGQPRTMLRSLAKATVARFTSLIGSGRAPGKRGTQLDHLLIDLHLRAAQAAYLDLRPDRLAHMRLAAMRSAARSGLSSEQAALLAHQSLLLSILERKRRRRRPLKASSVSEDTSDPAAIAAMTALRARSANQVGDCLEAERQAKTAVYEMGFWLDSREYVLTAADLYWNLMMRGKAKEAWRLVKHVFLHTAPGEGKGPMPLRLLPETGAMACLAVLGRQRAARFHLQRTESCISDDLEPYWRVAYLSGKLLCHRENRELGKPTEATLTAYYGLALNPRSLPLHLDLFLVTAAYVRADQFEAHSQQEGGRGLTDLQRAVKDLTAAADLPLLRGHSMVASAVLCRVGGRLSRAHELLDRAQALGDRLDAPWIGFEALCERARLRLLEDNGRAAERAASSALDIARQQEWRPRARRVRAEFGLKDPGARTKRRSERQDESHFARALQMSLLAANSPSPASQVRLLLDWLLRLFGGERALLVQTDTKTGELVLVSGRDLRGNDLDRIDQATMETCRRAVASKKSNLRISPPLGPAFAGRRGLEQNGERPIRSICAPVIRRNPPMGALVIEHHLRDSVFTKDDLEILEAIADYVPLALDLSDEARLEVYERIATNVPGLLFQFVRHPDGKRSYRYISQNVRLLGVTPTEARHDAESLISRIHPEDRDGFEQTMARSAETLGRWRWEGRYLLPDGSSRWFHGVAHPETQPGGAILWDGLIVDITRLKAAEARIRSLNEELETKVAERTQDLVLANQELEAFTYSVSHDLKTPLLSIQGFAEELSLMLPEINEEARDFLDRILASSRRMEVLIEAMLSLSRIAHQPLTRRPIDLSMMAAEIHHSLARREPSRQVVFAVEPGLICDVDEDLIRIVIENLIGNAWKFTRNKDVAHIRFFGRHREGGLVYTIEDDGAGFDMSGADQLFQPFSRLHSSLDFEGSGVGLATVRRVIQRHGGRVWAEGRPGQGASFLFTIGDRTLSPKKNGRRQPFQPKDLGTDKA